jgi:lipid intermediate transporter
LILFDVYLTWVRVEKYLSNYTLPPPPSGNHSSSLSLHFKTTFLGKLSTFRESDPIKLRLGGSPLILQYLFFLVLCAAETAGLHMSVRWGARWLLGYQRFHTHPIEFIKKLMVRGNIISTALFISSSMKLLPILTAIWEYDVPASARAVGWAVVVNNIEALTSTSPPPNDVDFSSFGNDVFEYTHVVVVRCFDTRIDRMDNSGLDNVGWCFGKTYVVGIGEIGSC